MDTQPKFAYHSSLAKGLTVIEPRVSTHRQPWVYATEDIVMSALFLTREDDFVCASGDFDGLAHVMERFAGAFDHAYKGNQGSIYVLPRVLYR